MRTDMTAPAAIDPFAPSSAGVYRDDLVIVRARPGPLRAVRPGTTRTASFDLEHVGPRLRVTHRLRPQDVDDDLSGRLATELFGPGWLRGSDLFERLFTGIVLTSAPDPMTSWLLFYRNSLARIDASLSAPAAAAPHGSIAEYAPVYGHAERLVGPGSVLELGCCFGFLSLRLAATGRQVTASDIDPGTVALVGAAAARLGVRLTTQVADAAAYPGPDGCADTVLLIHLLEHVDDEYGARVVAEALRLARRRVVVAVPLEAEADETWGHVRTVSLADLDALGRSTGLGYDVHEAHGGWLVLDVA